MTEPTPTNPTPVAVPWTPDMMEPQSAPAAPTGYQAPPQSPPGQYGQAIPAQAAPQFVPTYPQPQAQAQSQAQVQSQAHAIVQPVPQPIAQAVPQAVAVPHQPPARTNMPPAQFPPQGQPAQQQPYAAAPIQPQHGQPQYGQHPQGQAQFAPRPNLQPAHTAQHLQAGPPPFQAEMGQPLDNGASNNGASKSFLSGLLKRSPKPSDTSLEISAETTHSGLLFDKNFILGAVTGLVIGALILPMVFNMLGGEKVTQAQATPPPIVEMTPTTSDGNTFIDEAIAADAP